MKFRLVFVLITICLFLLAGCYTHVYNVGGGAENGKEVYSKWRSHWLFGIIDTNKEMDINQYCPSGKATVIDEHTFLNGLVGFFIGIVYSPTTVTILCDNGAKTEIELNEEQMNALVSDPEFLDYVEDVDPELLPMAKVASEMTFMGK